MIFFLKSLKNTLILTDGQSKNVTKKYNMTRISKDPEVRRNEILEVAYGMFIEFGYKKTSVERIIRNLNIAKGTFYYYFKSKADLLEALANQHAEAHYQSWNAIIEREDLDALQKINLVFNTSLNLKVESKDLLITYLKAMIDDQNIMFRYKLSEKRNRIAADYLEKVIEQGNREGVFNTPYPYDSILMILKLSESMTDEIVPLFLKMFQDKSYKEHVLAKYKMIEHVMERILGAEHGSIYLVEPDTLDKFI